MTCLYTQIRCKKALAELIPEVPVNQMHLLSNKSDNKVVLACLSGVRDYHQQFIFKSEQRNGYPFLMLFETRGRDAPAMLPQIKINGEVVLLRPKITYLRNLDCQSHYMGNDDSFRY